MSVYQLDQDEAVILQASGVSTGGMGSVDLILTNKNIIQVNKGFLGGAKDSEKYPLSSLKVLNGKANILVGKNKYGTKQLELYFSSYEKYYVFNTPFAIGKWSNAIIKAHKDRMALIAKKQKEEGPSIVDSLKGKLEKIIPTKEVVKKTCKCKKCGAELIGEKGSEVKCSYCDSITIIK